MTCAPFVTGFVFHSSNENCTQHLKLLNKLRVKIRGSRNGVAEDTSSVGCDSVVG